MDFQVQHRRTYRSKRFEYNNDGDVHSPNKFYMITMIKLHLRNFDTFFSIMHFLMAEKNVWKMRFWSKLLLKLLKCWKKIMFYKEMNFIEYFGWYHTFKERKTLVEIDKYLQRPSISRNVQKSWVNYQFKKDWRSECFQHLNWLFWVTFIEYLGIRKVAKIHSELSSGTHSVTVIGIGSQSF